MIPLAGRDGQILDLLVRVVRIGKHRGTWAGADVVRVAVDNLPAAEPYRRTLRAERRRAEAAEAEAKRLAIQLRVLEVQLQPTTSSTIEDLPPRRTVELNRSEYDVFSEFCEGKPREVIAEELGLAYGTVQNYVRQVAEQLGASTANQAAALVNRQVVHIQARKTRKKVA